MKLKVERLERGWGGHFICASMCRFRRNTLLTCGRRRVVVSTVGCYMPSDAKEPKEIGYNRHYETMVFRAKKEGSYVEADVSHQIELEGKWCLRITPENQEGVDNLANEMHEQDVEEIAGKLERGEL